MSDVRDAPTAADDERPDADSDSDAGAAAAAAAGDDRENIPSASGGILSSFWWGLFVVATLGAVVAAVLWQPVKPLPVLREAGSFEFTNQSGERFGSEALRGRVWVGSFIFTRCRNACPGMTGQMARLQQEIKKDNTLRRSVRLVSFSVDPSHDTPERLAAFAGRYGADPDLWSFLTGDRERIVTLCERGFGLAAGSLVGATGGPSSSPHSDRFSLVDGEGRVRGTYRPSGEEGDLESLLEDLRALVERQRRAGTLR